jgi:hypothetical protein
MSPRDQEARSGAGADPAQVEEMRKRVMASVHIDPAQVEEMRKRVMASVHIDPAQVEEMRKRVMASVHIDPAQVEEMRKRVIASVHIDRAQVEELESRRDVQELRAIDESLTGPSEQLPTPADSEKDDSARWAAITCIGFLLLNQEELLRALAKDAIYIVYGVEMTMRVILFLLHIVFSSPAL